jgi:hypothetical protein
MIEYDISNAQIRVAGRPDGALHHKYLRGIERRDIIYNDEDREDFLACMGAQTKGRGNRRSYLATVG